MRSVGLAPFVVDDVRAASPAAVSDAAAAPVKSLAGREQLDERLRRWEVERRRFERSRRPSEPVAGADADGAGAANR